MFEVELLSFKWPPPAVIPSAARDPWS